MIVEPFNISHLIRLQAQSSQRWITDEIRRDAIEAMARTNAFAAVTPERVLCCAGLIEVHPQRAVAWAACADRLAPYFPKIHHAALRLFKLSGYRRIEATVPCDFPAGHRWANALGFEVEADRMLGFGDDGKDHTLYRWRGAD